MNEIGRSKIILEKVKKFTKKAVPLALLAFGITSYCLHQPGEAIGPLQQTFNTSVLVYGAYLTYVFGAKLTGNNGNIK